MKLLIVEDSERLRRAISVGLQRSGYVVDCVGDGREALHLSLINDYDVIVLDLMLPSLDGLSILKALREKRKSTHVLILSAKDKIDDRIKGLNFGADDYLCKPFAFDELEARIKSLCRRAYHSKNPCIQWANATLDTAKRCFFIADTAVNLTPHEYALLELLALHHGNVVSYEQLENRLYASDTAVTRNAIEAHVSALRKKLKFAGLDGLIKTQRGFGYSVETPQ